MNVLSLFDGMSCGMLAMDRAGIPVDNYFSSEIDRYAIQVSNNNYPNIIRVGDVTQLSAYKSHLPKIDLLLGGSPCQGFSFAGRQLNFEDARSKLFFDFVRLKKETNPTYFLLENVKMKKEHQDVISSYVGVEPIEINSSLVSAQNRKRLYWTNIPNITQPKDKNILLRDVVGKDANWFYQRPRGKNEGGLIFDKSGTISANSWEQNNFVVCMHNLYGGFGEKEHRVFLDKSPTLRTSAGGGHIPSLLHSKSAIEYMNRVVSGGRNHWDFKHHSDTENPKSSAIVANFFKGVPYNVLKDNGLIRKFHPIECERLQTLPDNYTEGVSDTQRYKMIGNGWTVDVVAHILKKIKQ